MPWKSMLMLADSATATIPGSARLKGIFRGTSVSLSRSLRYADFEDVQYLRLTCQGLVNAGSAVARLEWSDSGFVRSHPLCESAPLGASSTWPVIGEWTDISALGLPQGVIPLRVCIVGNVTAIGASATLYWCYLQFR